MTLRFVTDAAIDALDPSRTEDLVKLLLLLSGRDASEIEADCQLYADRVSKIVGSLSAEARISQAQLNELLLLLDQRRISPAFFEAFLIGEPAGSKPVAEAILLRSLPEAVRRFRGYAVLAFGNFRFAFRELATCSTVEEIYARLGRWGRATGDIEDSYLSRPRPLVPHDRPGGQLPKAETWQLGYITVQGVFNDLALARAISASARGSTLETLTVSLEDEGLQNLVPIVKKYWPVASEALERWTGKIDEVIQELETLHRSLADNLERGEANTTMYLTWDYLDVYVATSMRYSWEFEETFDLATAVFGTVELRDLGLRWFDPTQSYEPSVIDKGLLEALMLRRAAVTLYMAQESDTLGKDSELAATLAQGKPVIAYIREVRGVEALKSFADELRTRNVTYFRRRLHTLMAEDTLRNPDSVSRIRDNLALMELNWSNDEVIDYSKRLLARVESLDESRTFQLLRSEQVSLSDSLATDEPDSAHFLAAVESAAMDARATTLQRYHPLAMQVHLDTGVANGVMVARSVDQCARLLRGVLLNEMEFDLQEERTSQAGNQRTVATVLAEKTSGSRFRVVTANETLTNSFWNFYLSGEEDANRD